VGVIPPAVLALATIMAQRASIVKRMGEKDRNSLHSVFVKSQPLPPCTREARRTAQVGHLPVAPPFWILRVGWQDSTPIWTVDVVSCPGQPGSMAPLLTSGARILGKRRLRGERRTDAVRNVGIQRLPQQAALPQLQEVTRTPRRSSLVGRSCSPWRRLGSSGSTADRWRRGCSHPGRPPWGRCRHGHQGPGHTRT
jgi:hypothetical protein